MEIKYLGHSSFFIKTDKTRVLMDPFDPKFIGLKFAKTEADIVTVSHQHQDHNYLAVIGGEPLVIDLPGEFEKNGVRVFGFKSYHDKKKGEERGDNIIFKIKSEGIDILHCGDLGFVPDDDFIDQLGTIDILMVPVGGFYTIDSTEAVELVKKIEPSITIPMHYGHDKLSPDLASKLAPLNEFLKKMDHENLAPIPKLVVKKDQLQEEMKVITLEV